MRISEVFNDFYSLLIGKKCPGLGTLMEKYREEPLFWIMLSNLQNAAELPLFDAMQDAYRLYKELEEKRGMTEEEMQLLYERILTYGQKWNNLWCWQLAGALTAELDAARTQEENLKEAA